MPKRRDSRAICHAVSEVPFSEKVISSAYELSHGNMRRLIKAIEHFEERIRKNKSLHLSKRELQEIEAAGLEGRQEG